MKGKSSAHSTESTAGRWASIERYFKPTIIILSTILIVCVLVAGVVGVIRAKQRHDLQQQQAKRHALIVRASKVLEPKDVSRLEPITKEIKALPNYQNDPSYVYILLVYYINLSDSPNATHYLVQLNKISKSNLALEPVLQSNAPSRQDLQKNISFLENQSNAYSSQVIGIPQQ